MSDNSIDSVVENTSTIIADIESKIPELEKAWFLAGALWAHKWTKKNLTDGDFFSEAEKQAISMVKNNDRA